MANVIEAPLPGSAPTPRKGFRDSLGDRRIVPGARENELLEVLHLRRELTAVPSFEFALRERAARLANFQHNAYARVRQIDRLPQPDGRLAVVSEYVPGWRLAEILSAVQDRHLELDINAALSLIKQLVHAVAILHQHARGVAHGALGPERVVVTAHARLTIVEYVLGSALERLEWPRERCWRDLRVAVPASAGAIRFDPRTDVTQVGTIAMALVLGCPLSADDYPDHMGELLAMATENRTLGGRRPLSKPLRAWLSRTLQLDLHRSFPSAIEAESELEALLIAEPSYVAAPVALESFLAAYQRATAVTQETPAALLDDEEEEGLDEEQAADEEHEVVIPVASTSNAAEDAIELDNVIADLDEVLEQTAAKPQTPPPPAAAVARPVIVATVPPPAAVAVPPKAVAASTPPPMIATVPPSPPPPSAPRVASAAPREARSVETVRPEPVEGRTSREPRAAKPVVETSPVIPTAPAQPAPVVERTAPPAPKMTTPAMPKPSPALRESHAAAVSKPAQPLRQQPATYGSMFGSSATADVRDESDDERDTSAAGGMARKGGALRLILIAAAVLVVLGGGYFGYRMLSGPSTPPPTTGTLTIESQPAGLAISIDGSPRGATPLKVALPAGQHQIQFDSGGQSRVMPITITAGMQTSQYIESQASPATGKLQVTSQPPGATVIVDGEKKGVAPLLVSDLAVGRHKVELQADGSTVQQQVTIEPGATNSLIVPTGSATSGPVSGWLAVGAPVELQVFEGGQLIGSSQSDRILITAGRHDVELVNETLGYRDRQIVQVPPGKVASIKVQLPKGSLSVNAVPWAEVSVDGQPAGQTPIGNLSLPIGPHEIVFRHPQFGEQRHAVTVTTKAPARVSVDLRK